jgi:hypothetical protein
MKRMSDTTATAAGANMNWVAVAAIILVGALAMFSIYKGFEAFGNENMEEAFMYLVIGASGFVAIGYSFFRARSVSKESLEMKKTDVITTLECPQCNLKRVRSFQRGDYLFKSDEPCTRCEGNMLITRIHTRKEEKKS